MIIFLDCDGVFHPPVVDTKDDFFDPQKIQVFEDILDDLPDAKVVISSSWRINQADMEVMMNAFEGKIKDRIIGFTPVFPYHKGQGRPDGNKEMEIQLFFDEHEDDDLRDEPWIAIDDEERMFYAGATLFLLDSNIGLLESHKEQIIDFVNEQSNRPLTDRISRREDVISAHKKHYVGFDIEHDFYQPVI